MSAVARPRTQVVTGELHRVWRGHKKGFPVEPTPEPERRPARIAVTLALAHMIQRAIDTGEIRDQAEAARRLGVTRARMTQLIDLTYLAPDVQEFVLHPDIDSSSVILNERLMRRTTSLRRWSSQRLLVFGAGNAALSRR